MIQLATLNQQLTAANRLNELIPLTAVIETALCVGAGGSSGSLADKPILKNAEGRLIIPASQLKGRLRHECEKLTRSLGWPTCESPVAQTMCPQAARLSENLSENFRREAYRLRDFLANASQEPQYHCLICQLFGNPAIPARVQFSDLVCTEPPENIPAVLRPGVAINRRRHTAEEGKLYFFETSPANVALRFEGTLHIQSPWPLYEEVADAADVAKALMLVGLRHIHALGGSKSTGLGWLHWDWPEQTVDISESVWTFLGSAQSQLSGTVIAGESS